MLGGRGSWFDVKNFTVLRQFAVDLLTKFAQLLSKTLISIIFLLLMLVFLIIFLCLQFTFIFVVLALKVNFFLSGVSFRKIFTSYGTIHGSHIVSSFLHTHNNFLVIAANTFDCFNKPSFAFNFGSPSVTTFVQKLSCFQCLHRLCFFENI